jgi:hypothetical protein
MSSSLFHHPGCPALFGSPDASLLYRNLLLLSDRNLNCWKLLQLLPVVNFLGRQRTEHWCVLFDASASVSLSIDTLLPCICASYFGHGQQLGGSLRPGALTIMTKYAQATLTKDSPPAGSRHGHSVSLKNGMHKAVAQGIPGLPHPDRIRHRRSVTGDAVTRP